MYIFGTLAFTPHKLVLCVAHPGNNAQIFLGPSWTDVDVDVDVDEVPQYKLSVWSHPTK